ncbi:DUF1285 domain-containing protein [Aquirhabdus sp.]|uniref:DUF1285 domain-containing protein n=1 Tax=Aquirhabdus sp. TaxID=2824160 RepID=UPI00396C905D
MTKISPPQGNLGQSTAPAIDESLSQNVPLKKTGGLDSISRLLVGADGKPTKSLPPLEKWNPEYCGEMDLVIRANGEWWHEGTRMTREPLIKLFSTVLWREGDEYFLKTPVEKIKIQVVDAPLMVVDVEQVEDNGQTFVRCTTKTGDVVIADAEHSIEMREFMMDGVSEIRPYIRIRRNLDALIHRNAFYHLVNWSVLEHTDAGEAMVLRSGDEQFVLGLV